MRIFGLVFAAILAAACGNGSGSNADTVILVTATSGPGALSLQPAPEPCPTCATGEFQYRRGTTVAVVPQAGTGTVLTGWSGACAGTTTCTVHMDGDRTVTASFLRDTTALAVQLGGDGSGNVKSDVAGIDCGGLCVSEFTTGSTVTLTAAASAGSTFGGWAGGCQGNGPCVVLVDRARSISAIFNRSMASLTVQKTGPGTVYSAPAGIACGAGCVAQLPAGSSVSLVATPDANATFVGWGGACSGTGACWVSLSLNASQTVTAVFTRPQFRVSVLTAGTGTGSVISSPLGISCGASCVSSFDQGSQVILLASPGAGSMFQGWSGDCTGINVCVLSIAADRAVTASFVPAPPGLPQNPAPTLLAMNPTRVLVGSTGVTLTLTGLNFVAGSVAFWAGQPRATQFVDGNTLRMTLLDADLTTGAQVPVAIGTPAPGGGISASAYFTVTDPIPVVTSISPAFVLTNSAPFQMTINGSGFTPTTKVLLSYNQPPVTYVSSTQLLASIDATLLSSAAAYTLTAVNGYGSYYNYVSSNPVPFEVRYPVPAVTSIVPSSAVAGSADVTVTIYGSSFFNNSYSWNGSYLQWNGKRLTTIYLSGTELRAVIPADQLVAAGTGQITAFTTGTGGGTSGAMPFTIQAAPPRIVAIQPDSVTAGAPAQTMTIHGTGFTTASTVTWNGAPRTATFVDATQLTIPIAAADVSSVGSATIALSDPSSTVPTPGIGLPILAAAPAVISNVAVAVTAKDLAWDPGRRRIYASVPGTAPAYANSIVAIDVDAGTVTSSVRVGSEPGLLSLSDDRSKLYVILDGASLVVRVDVASWQLDLDVPLGPGVSGVDLQAVPGSPRSVAVARKQAYGYSYSGANGIAIYDDAVPRPESSFTSWFDTNTVSFAAPDVIYSVGSGGTLHRLQVLPTGAIPSNDTFPFSGYNLDVRYDSARLYATSGVTADLTGSRMGTFPIQAGTNPAVAPDWVHGRVFFLAGASLQAFTASTFVSQGSLTLTPGASAGRFVRWDTNGIAYRSPTQVVLLRSSLIGG